VSTFPFSLFPASLRARLLLLLLSTTLLLWSVAGVLSFFEAHHEIEELFDAQLASSARILLAQAGHAPGEIKVGSGTEFHKYERKIAFRIWDEHGRQLLRSANVPPHSSTDERTGFYDVAAAGEKWRVFSHWEEKERLWVQVAESYEVRDELTEAIAARLLYPLVFALPLLAFLVWLGVGKGLAPLQRVAVEVSRRAPQHLSQLKIDGVPGEIRPLVAALNALLARLEQALENERRFTADAAHELRTPLAGLKTQAQVALRATNDGQRQHALRQVVAGTDHATRLVEQLLTLARLDPGAKPSQFRPLDLRALLVECVMAQAPQALEKSIELSVADGDGKISGDPTMLAVLMRNLVDNAIRYTPPGGWVKTGVRNTPDGVVLDVSDSGPGVAEEEREQVLRRFYRVLGSGAEGSGLGLSIAQRVAELHGGTLELGESEAGGLAVRVHFAGG
jgi:two-component system sensor histidine kinase QseC